MAGSKKVLFVEDDRAISDMYARALTRNGYKVDFAYDGDEGLKMVMAKAYDLVLLDIMMPGKTGIEVLGEIRGANGRGMPETKVVILTNLAQKKASEEALRAQADGYIIKADVVPSQLVSVIEKLI
jgi:DNA-binding response OmpR family regulator